MKKQIALFVVVILLITMIPFSALAASGTISADGTYDISAYGNNSVITINGGLTVTLTNTNSTTYTNLSIDCIGADTKLTIDGVKLDNSAFLDTYALSFTGSDNTLTIVGNSELKSGMNEPGIRAESGTSLDILGDGMLAAYGGSAGAGIGSGESSHGGSITITDGTVTARGGLCAAGIGGGNCGNGGSITILGGDVTATGNSGSAGIGGGVDGDGGIIHITGGTLTITGSEGGAGIGGGYNEGGGTMATGGNITIDGGIVTATSGPKAAGIGGGFEGDGGSITISGTADVSATGGYGAAGIGGGYNDVGSTVATGGTIYIDGGIVTATGGGYGAGIGGGVRGDGGSITISGSADVTTTGNGYGAGIGGGRDGAGGMIHIDGGTVTAIGGEYSAGIGGGYRDHGGNITISGGIIYSVKGADGKHDIGDGVDGSGGTLQISGDAGVFLANDECISPTTTHTHFDITEIDNGKLYGIETPVECTRAGGYFMPITLSYDPNGGAGTVPGNVIQHLNTMVTVAAKGDLTNERLAMVQWNTDADGEGYGYFPSVDITLTEDVTLYAIWRDRDVTSVTLDKHMLSLTHHGTDTLTATVDPSESTKNDVVWYSQDTSVATVDQSGNVAAMGVGTATIVAWADGVRDTCAVTVGKKMVTGVTLSNISKTLTKGEMTLLKATVLPSDATDTDVTWTSSNTSVATVDGGVVTAVGAGTATITAMADSKMGSCVIIVNEAADDSDTQDDTDDNDTDDNDTNDDDTYDDGDTDTDSDGDEADVKEDTPDTGDDTQTVTPEEVVETQDSPKIVIVYIDVSDLPEGTEAVRLADGSIVEIDGGTLQLEIDKGYLGQDGSMEVVALSGEGTPLSNFDVQVQPAQIASSGDTNAGGITPALWVLIGIAGAAAVAVLVFLLSKKKV